MRELSLDNLPNLLNGLRGGMGLVGPRPMEPEQVGLSDPAWQRILSARPGLLSLAILRLALTPGRGNTQARGSPTVRRASRHG